MPHPEREHELQIALATALRERDDANARAEMSDKHFSDCVPIIRDLKADISDTRTTLQTLIEASEALREGVIPMLYDEDLTKERMVEHIRRLPTLLNASTKATTAARAALAGGGDRG